MIEEDKQALFLKLKSWYERDIKWALAWRQKAREDYEFYNGEQWSGEDRLVLQRNRRPVMTFNRIAPLVNAVIGAEINNRRQVRFIPRNLGEAKADDMLTGLGEWFRYTANAVDEESEAFADTVIAGMGWVDTGLDFDNSADGVPMMQRLDPFKMAWDCNATKSNLTDATRMWYVDEKPIDQLREMFPDIDEAQLDAAWARRAPGAAKSGDMVTIVEARWFEYQEAFQAPDIITGEKRVYSAEKLAELLQDFPNLPHHRFRQRIVKRAFLGAELLGDPDSPLVPHNQLGWECITGYYNRAERQFYGLVRPTKDPQRWANKFFSQVMHVLNSQAKGGLLAERGAFDDDAQAEESFARADQITWLRNGALSATAPRIQPKPAAQFPSGFFQLFEESKNAIMQVTGLSPEFIGTREVNQPGILENQRRQSSLNLLAYIFNSLKKYRKRQAMLVLHLLQNYLSDGRMVRIIGEENQQYVPLTRAVCAQREYDVIVDDAPTTANEKERTFAILQQILPMIAPYLTPQMGLEMLKYTPLPASLIEKWSAEASVNLSHN
ncbi:MAG: portal protein [Alphaproteobacteria bacterium]|nr:portal protein [Alphaproteobacteria bacterium]